MPCLDVRTDGNSQLRSMLSRHPFVRVVDGDSESAIEFEQHGRTRRVWVGRQDIEQFGIVELIDNNPLVCTDDFSVPSGAATLALVALGPLIKAGILAETPTAILSFDADRVDVEASLARSGWDRGITLTSNPQDLGWTRAGTFISVIRTPNDPAEIDAIYDDIYGSSFFVRRSEIREPTPELANCALYRIRYAPDEPTSLLTVHVLADIRGKAGAGQQVHAFNVMAGFEESLAISG